MKYTLLFLLLLLASCSVESNSNVILNAVPYIGKTETSNQQELAAYMGIDPKHTKWYAAFVNAVLHESNIAGSETVSDNPLLARSFLKWGYKIDTKNIKSGDLVIFPRGNTKWEGHVGFYLKTVDVNGTIYYAILGGNQSNQVSIELYKADTVLGIRRISM